MSIVADAYRAPDAHVGSGLPEIAESDAVSLRNEYLAHEGAVQSIGSLYFLSSFFFLLAAGAFLLVKDGEGADLPRWFSLMFASFAVLFGWMGRTMRRLDRAGRIPVAIVAGLGLLNPPVGTLINGYILFLVFGKKGRMVFSEEYAAARAATPDLKHRSPMLVKVLLGVLIALIAVGVVAVLFEG